MIVLHKETGKKLYVVSTRLSYGGVRVYECVSIETAEKLNYNIPSYLTGLYYIGSLGDLYGFTC